MSSGRRQKYKQVELTSMLNQRESQEGKTPGSG